MVCATSLLELTGINAMVIVLFEASFEIPGVSWIRKLSLIFRT